MTGFGRASVDAGERRLRVEIRSVNHRGLDLKVRSAEPDAYCDAEIGRAVRASVERGSVTVSIRDEESKGADGIDERRVRAVYETLERLRQELEIEEPVNLATVGAFMNAGAGADLSGEALWDALRPAVSIALVELTATRAREGEALARDLEDHRARLDRLAADLRRATAVLPDRFAKRLTDRLAAAAQQPGWDAGRLAQETALIADRLDVSEELVRLETHLRHFKDLIGQGGSVGRKLDFVIQEIGRELNTIASKSQDAAVAGMVIDAKAELEKMREQAQNVE
jgi:uncharacterized protein (TIGR00255 family)